MAQILHLQCRYCGEDLANRERPYCPPCNLYLCYRAMPLLLGMLLTREDLLKGLQQKQKIRVDTPQRPPAYEHNDDPCIMVAYSGTAATNRQPSAYEDEPCIMVAY